GIGSRGEHAQESAFTGDVAVRIEGAYPDVVQVDGAVHRGPRVRLGDREQVGLARGGAGLGAQLRVDTFALWRLPQDAQARPGDRTQHVGALHRVQGVLAVAE